MAVSLIRNALEAYVCSANDVLDLKLVRSEDDLQSDKSSFKPDFTHQVYGENESIFGFKDLQVQLYYTAGALTTYLNMTHTKKLGPDKFDGVEADDVLGKLAGKMPPSFHSNMDEFVKALRDDAKFKPMGTKLHETSIETDGKTRQFVIHQADVETPGFREFHERLQTFILWFIDAASYIDLDDDRWKFFLVFEKYAKDGKPAYATVGYTTVYHYYAYPDKTRPRISQMLILPPFQRVGLGAILLQTIYNYYLSDPQVLNITVEDPSENFVRLRDYVDSRNCLKLPSFQTSCLLKGFSPKMVQEAEQKLKLNKKQARRVYEILRLQATDVADKQQYKEYRLDVKKRLNLPFQKQQTDLAKLSKSLRPDELKATMNCTTKEQRIDHLDREFQELEAEYRQTLERLATSSLS